jgi:hypothetical protein
MKKAILILSISLVILMAVIYLFIPATYIIKPVVNSTIRLSAAQRKILHPQQWTTWMPGIAKNDSSYLFNNCLYHFDDIVADGLVATLNMEDNIVKGSFYYTILDTISLKLGWTSTVTLSNNPFNRIGQYLAARKINTNMQAWLDSTAEKFNSLKYLYGFEPKLQKVTDQYMISVKQDFSSYPKVAEVYTIIDEIQAYIQQNGGTQKSPPMLNVHQQAPNNYQVMIAVPTTTMLPASGKFLQKEMVLGNIVMAEIKGGMEAILKAEKELHHYILDYNKTSPAIPFQSLVTDRRAEKDSNKWTTKLYYPVFY